MGPRAALLAPFCGEYARYSVLRTLLLCARTVPDGGRCAGGCSRAFTFPSQKR